MKKPRQDGPELSDYVLGAVFLAVAVGLLVKGVQWLWEQLL